MPIPAEQLEAIELGQFPILDAKADTIALTKKYLEGCPLTSISTLNYFFNADSGLLQDAIEQLETLEPYKSMHVLAALLQRQDIAALNAQLERIAGFRIEAERDLLLLHEIVHNRRTTDYSQPLREVNAIALHLEKVPGSPFNADSPAPADLCANTQQFLLRACQRYYNACLKQHIDTVLSVFALSDARVSADERTLKALLLEHIKPLRHTGDFSMAQRLQAIAFRLDYEAKQLSSKHSFTHYPHLLQQLNDAMIELENMLPSDQSHLQQLQASYCAIRYAADNAQLSEGMLEEKHDISLASEHALDELMAHYRKQRELDALQQQIEHTLQRAEANTDTTAAISVARRLTFEVCPISSMPFISVDAEAASPHLNLFRNECVTLKQLQHAFILSKHSNRPYNKAGLNTWITHERIQGRIAKDPINNTTLTSIPLDNTNVDVDEINRLLNLQRLHNRALLGALKPPLRDMHCIKQLAMLPAVCLQIRHVDFLNSFEAHNLNTKAIKQVNRLIRNAGIKAAKAILQHLSRRGDDWERLADIPLPCISRLRTHGDAVADLSTELKDYNRSTSEHVDSLQKELGSGCSLWSMFVRNKADKRRELASLQRQQAAIGRIQPLFEAPRADPVPQRIMR